MMALAQTGTGDAAAAAARAREAICRHGGEPVSMQPIGAFQGLKRAGRHCFRVVCESGRVLKARDMGDAREAEELAGLREGLDPAFVPVLRRDGQVLVEDWVEGSEADLRAAGSRSEPAGALLGGLHARPFDGESSTAGYLEVARSDLELLQEDGGLEPRECAAIAALLGELDPGSFRPVLVHRDYCPENFVIDPAGGLHVIDNEWFEAGAAGFDLARAFSRWPMEEAVRSRFLDGYSRLSEVPAGLRFWTVVESLSSARVYRQFAPPRAEPFLETLRRLARADRAAR
jgi:aminoglycoside phosphotransferase (APT) family kinase protein